VAKNFKICPNMKSSHWQKQFYSFGAVSLFLKAFCLDI
jgi:hypothetical protein